MDGDACQRPMTKTCRVRVYEPMNMSMLSWPRIGAFLFCSWLKNSCLYLAGIEAGSTTAGMLRYKPVRGGERCSSRARWLITAAKFAPAEMPPTTKPFLASAFKAVALEAACQVSVQTFPVTNTIFEPLRRTHPFDSIPGIIDRRRKWVLRC